MSKPNGIAEVLWQLQDLREQLIIAEAERVRIERVIRETVRYPPNRAGRYRGGGRVPLYADPASAVEALRALAGLAWLARPGMKSRVRPGVLLEKWEKAANEAQVLRSRVARLEDGMTWAGVDVP